MNRWGRLLAAGILLCAGPLRADSFLSWSAKAEKAERRKDGAEALQAWSNALRLWKTSDGKKKKAKACAARAALYEEKGDWEAAAADLTEAVKNDAKDAAVFHRRGRLCLDHGKTAEAISDFYKATALRIDFAEAFFDRARAYTQQGDEDFSREDYRTACSLGLKKACAQVKPEKPAPKGKLKSPVPPKAQAETGAPAPEAAPEEPARPAAENDIPAATAAEKIPLQEVSPAETAQPPAPVFKDCLSRLGACSDEGASYSSCVARAKLCEDDPKKGCCPRDCVTMFTQLANRRSEAQAFREVFIPKSPCLPKGAPAP